VSGLTTVSVSYHAGHRHGAKARVALLIDEGASAEQERALADAFTGKLGGPLEELAEMTGEVSSVQRAHMSFTYDEATTEVTAGEALTVTMSPLTGSTGRICRITVPAGRCGDRRLVVAVAVGCLPVRLLPRPSRGAGQRGRMDGAPALPDGMDARNGLAPQGVATPVRLLSTLEAVGNEDGEVLARRHVRPAQLAGHPAVVDHAEGRMDQRRSRP